MGLAMASVLVLALLCLLEMALRSLDYGYPTTFFLEDIDTGKVVENERFVWQFYNTQSSLKPHPFQFASPRIPTRSVSLCSVNLPPWAHRNLRSLSVASSIECCDIVTRTNSLK